MKTVRDACTLQDNALEIRISDQIEQLDELINVEGDGSEFFEKTHITQGMQQLISEGIARLAGASSQAIFHLKQAMGGGKTHLLVGFGLLAKHPTLRAKYCAGLSHVDSFESTAIAAFNGRNNPNHYFWGEIAEQLGKSELFTDFWTTGPKAPDKRDWLNLFEGDEPILILLDEMPPYFHYLDTQKVGNGTVADIATRAFANMLVAADEKKNVCVVISDLTAAYDSGSRLINTALRDAAAEVGRQERPITPVDLSANEIYEILRKRLFKSMPDHNNISEIASAFSRKLIEATKAKTVNRGAEAISDEITYTYPFHPKLKNVIALFKENEQFKQTRGLLELVSRLLKSVWERKDNDIFLIGPQHFDLSIPEVRDKLTEFSGMSEVISTDIWDANMSAHAQLLDLERNSEVTSEVAALLLTASLSTAVNAVKGLTKEEVVECLVNPLHEPSEYITSFEELNQTAWYLHHTSDDRYYFDKQENLTKLLQSLAKDAPPNQVDELIRHRLHEMFEGKRKMIYDEVFPLPKLEDVVNSIRKGRVLLIVSPDSKIPPEEVQRFFEGLSQKNNICVLTGDKTAMASLEKAARHVFAGKKADGRIPIGHSQREDLEQIQESYEHSFNSTVLGLFDKVLFPIERPGRGPELVDKPLDMTRDATRPFNGEEQIEKTLITNPLKLFIDVEANFDPIRVKAENLLWPQNQDETRWSDAADRYSEQSGMQWLPPRGLDTLKSVACNRGLWEDLGNGYITKKPKKKTTSAQIIAEQEFGDEGRVRLKIIPLNAGPAPQIHFAEDGPVSETSPVLKDNPFSTTALRVAVLTIDPSGQFETGDPEVWKNKLFLSNNLKMKSGKRQLELFVAPRGEIRYTLDGSEPREGTIYTSAFDIGNDEVLVNVFACAEEIEAKQTFRFPAKGSDEVPIDEVKPAALISRSGLKLDARTKVFEAFQQAEDKNVTFKKINLTVGQGDEVASITVGNVEIKAPFLLSLIEILLEKFSAETPITMTFGRAEFSSGHDLKAFCEKLNLKLSRGSVEQ